jgi:glucose/arabinose dehydrogenase
MGAILLRLIPVSLALFLLSACSDDPADDTNGDGAPAETFNFGVGAVTIAGNGAADRVSAIAFAPDGRIFYAEQLEGTIRVINADGTLQEEPFAQLTVADHLGQDWGLTGLALAPDFATSHHVFAFYTDPLSAPPDEGATPAPNVIGRPKLVRLTEKDGVGTDQKTISEGFPETDPAHAGFNANGEIHFGPDGMLYASLGDYDLFQEQPDLVTSLGTPIGKILRMKPDGAAAAGNPFADDPDADPRIFASGFREPFPFTFAPDETLYGTDNTTVSCEELNVILAGKDYGWPGMGEFPFGDCAAGPGEQPVYNMARDGLEPNAFVSFVEASGLSYLEDSTYELIPDSLVVCESRKSPDKDGAFQRGVLKRFTFTDPSTVESYEQISDNCYGEVRTYKGEIYYATDNAIQKLVPSSEAETPAGASPAEETQPGQQVPPTPAAPAS